MINRLCVFSVVHPACVSFLNDFLKSLDNQTNSNFHLFLVIDKLPLSVVQKIVQNDFHKFKVFFFEHSGGLLENRVKGLLHLAKNYQDYKAIVFGDADDIFSDNFLEEIAYDINHYDIVISDLIPFVTNELEYSSKPVWRNRLQEIGTLNISFLKDKNIVGFGNTSIDFKLLKRLKNQYPEPLAPDWFFFKQLFLPIDRIKFNDKVVVYYRQHSSNIAGFKLLTSDKLKHILRVKEDHYKLMNYNDAIILEEINNGKELIKSKQKFNQSIENLNQNAINYFWWEESIYLKTKQ